MSVDCWKLTVPELKQMCKQRGVKGYSTWNKDSLVKGCCDVPDVPKLPSPRPLPRAPASPPRSIDARSREYQRMLDAREERARREREERENRLREERVNRLREEKERRERQEEERQRNVATFKADTETILPSNIKKIKHVKDYKKKDEKYQLELVNRIRLETWGMQNPMYVGADAIPCPASINVLREWMENGYVNDEKAEQDRSSRIEFDTISMNPSSNWSRAEYNKVAEVKSRRSDVGDYEFIMIPEELVKRDVMTERLKRFRGVLGKQCFELDSSDSKKLYGIFLKK